MPTISVIMSVYNEPIEWIRQSIESILNQTFTDFEFIIINDNPERKENDGILNEYAERDSRIRLIKNEANLGLPESLNKGIRESKGALIARMDADDISRPTRFENQVSFMDAHPNIGVCGTSVRTIDAEGKISGRKAVFTEDKDLKSAIYFFSPFIHPSIILRKELVAESGYDKNCRVAQDYNLWVRLSDHTDFANISEPLLYYRVHGNQSQKKAGKAKSIESRQYNDSLCADRMNLPSEMRELYIAIRGGRETSVAEIERLYAYLITEWANKRQRVHVMRSFFRAMRPKGIKACMSTSLIWENPFLTVNAVCKDLYSYVKS